MTTSHAERVAATVRAEVARQRVPQRTIAAALGLSQSSLSRRLLGEVALTLTELQQIATTLDVPVTALVPPGALVPGVGHVDVHALPAPA